MSRDSVFRKPEDFFTVESIRNVPDPNNEIQRRELVVSLKELPYFFDDVMHLGPNPRRPNRLSSGQREEIKDSLVNSGEYFHHLNRGLTVVAKSIVVDDSNKNKLRVKLSLAENRTEAEFFGLLDGGHTNEIVNQYRNEVMAESGESSEALRTKFVNLQVLIPEQSDEITDEIKNLLRSIAHARNNNVQVKQRDLENLAHAFDSIKAAIDSESYADQVRWRDGDDQKPIDGQTLLILLMMFHEHWVGYSDDPVAAYGQKGVCLDAFKLHLEKNREYTEKLVRELPLLLQLFDRIELDFPEAYNEAGGKFGKYNNVKRYDSDDKAFTQLRTPTRWKYTSAWIFPIYAGFRQLLNYKNGEFVWVSNPVEFWEKHAVKIVSDYQNVFKPIASASATKVGRNTVAFQVCRMTVKLLTT